MKVAYVASVTMPDADLGLLPSGSYLCDGSSDVSVDDTVRMVLADGAGQVRAVWCNLTPYLIEQIAAGRVWYWPYTGETLRRMVERNGI